MVVKKYDSAKGGFVAIAPQPAPAPSPSGPKKYSTQLGGFAPIKPGDPNYANPAPAPAPVLRPSLQGQSRATPATPLYSSFAPQPLPQSMATATTGGAMQPQQAIPTLSGAGYNPIEYVRQKADYLEKQGGGIPVTGSDVANLAILPIGGVGGTGAKAGAKTLAKGAEKVTPFMKKEMLAYIAKNRATILKVSALKEKAALLAKAEGKLAKTGKDIITKAPKEVAEKVSGKAAKAAGEISLNTKTAAVFAGLLKKLAIRTTIGGGGVVSISYLYKVFTGDKSAQDDFTGYIEKGNSIIPDLREAGLNEEADEIEKSFPEMKDNLKEVSRWNVFSSEKNNIIQEGIRRLSEISKALETKNQADAKQKIAELEAQQAADEKAAAEAKVTADKLAREQKLTDIAEGRTYAEGRETEQRKYDEGRTAEQRTYSEQQAAASEQARLQEQGIADDTALESDGGSVLEFGLLKSGGSKEFVNRDKAAQVYFGKPYVELTPEQRRLLNLLKGDK